MAFVTFEDYDGNKIEVNSALVQAISTFQHYDHDLEVPDKLLITNGDGLPEVNPEKRAEVDKLRTSERTVISYATGAIVVKGTQDEVKNALSEKQQREKA